MMYVPVIIITLCRFEELKRCIESLQRNPYAQNTELYVGVDYPSKDSHREGYAKIVKYLRDGVDGFANIQIIEQAENKGWFDNFISVRDVVYQKYDRFIYLEDDIETSPNFLQYMNINLDRFEDDDNVQCICGYSYPFHWKADGNNIVKVNTYFAAWGYGTWRKKEQEMYDAISMSVFDTYMHQIGRMLSFFKASPNQFCNFIKGMVEYIPVLVKDDEIVKLDIAFSIHIYMNNKCSIFPKVSKTRNIGYGDAGMNCDTIAIDESRPVNARNFDYTHQEIDTECEYHLQLEENLSLWQENNDKLKQFYHVETKESIRVMLAYMMYLLLGRQRTQKLLRRHN